jgi:hypothetical protein
MAEYVTLVQAKRWLNLTDELHDPDVQHLIPVASAAVDDYCGRRFGVHSYTELYDGHAGRLLPLRNVPVISVASCTVDDKEIEVRIIPEIGLVRSLGVFTRGLKNVAVTYDAGHAQIPEPVQQAVLYTLSALFTAPAHDQNLVGETVAGVFSGAYQPGGPGSVPLAAQNLLRHYRHLWHGSL